MKTKNIVIWLLLLGGLGFFFQSATAQETKNTVVATVDLQNARIIEQNGHKLKLGFDISNQQNVQPGVKYAAALLAPNSNYSPFPLHQKTYAETLILKVGETISREVTYNIPDFFSGQYQIAIVSQNEKGLPFDVKSVGEISLAGKDGLEFIKESCYLTVAGEMPAVKYELSKNVDLFPEEKLLVSCQVKNTASSDLTAKVMTAVHSRSLFGKTAGEQKAAGGPFTFKAGEQKELVFALPPVKDPQFYFAETYLAVNGRPISNFLYAKYILRGQLASIFNLRLGKDAYQKGEQAKIFFDWIYGNLVSDFPGSRGEASKLPRESNRLQLEIILKDSQQKDCAPVFSADLGEFKTVGNVYSIPIASDCYGFTFQAIIKNGNGRILDEITFTTASQKPPWKWLDWRGIVIILIIIIVVVFLAIKFFNQKNNQSGGSNTPKIALLCVVIFAGLLLVAGKAKAGCTLDDGVIIPEQGGRMTYLAQTGIENSIFSCGANAAWTRCESGKFVYYGGLPGKVYPYAICTNGPPASCTMTWSDNTTDIIPFGKKLSKVVKHLAYATDKQTKYVYSNILETEWCNPTADFYCDFTDWVKSPATSLQYGSLSPNVYKYKSCTPLGAITDLKCDLPWGDTMAFSVSPASENDPIVWTSNCQKTQLHCGSVAGDPFTWNYDDYIGTAHGGRELGWETGWVDPLTGEPIELDWVEGFNAPRDPWTGERHTRQSCYSDLPASLTTAENGGRLNGGDIMADPKIYGPTMNVYRTNSVACGEVCDVRQIRSTFRWSPGNGPKQVLVYEDNTIDNGADNELYDGVYGLPTCADRCPTLNFYTINGSNPTIANGESIDLLWTTNPNTVSCKATGSANNWASNNKPISSTGESTGPLTATTTYTLECFNAENSPVTASVMVNIINPCTPKCVDDEKPCSVSCGGGKKKIKRCTDDCQNYYDVTESCNTHPCPPKYREVSPW
ncbi:MAG: hypothetical protein V1690_02950 [Candidatus Moraniibacteriota bacterium]